MTQHSISKNKSFYCIGLSYQKADATIRGMFSLTLKIKTNYSLKLKKKALRSFLLISTCNRTELYGYAEHPFQLIQLLCKYAKGSVDDFQKSRLCKQKAKKL